MSVTARGQSDRERASPAAKRVAHTVLVESAGDVHLECEEHLDMKCKSFALSADKDISLQAKEGLVVNAGKVAGVLGQKQVQIQAPDVLIN